MTHNIKLREEYADAVYSGEKNFEIRYNDRGYQKGDVVVFRVVDEACNTVSSHPLNGIEFEITYLIHGYGLKDGWCVFGIKRKEVDMLIINHDITTEELEHIRDLYAKRTGVLKVCTD